MSFVDYYVILENKEKFSEICKHFGHENSLFKNVLDKINYPFVYFQNVKNTNCFVCFFCDTSKTKIRLYVYSICLTDKINNPVAKTEMFENILNGSFKPINAPKFYYDIIVRDIYDICNNKPANKRNLKYIHIYSIFLINYHKNNEEENLPDYFNRLSGVLNVFSNEVPNQNDSHIFGNNKSAHILSKNCEKCGNIII